jgi:hypothetical protein
MTSTFGPRSGAVVVTLDLASVLLPLLRAIGGVA